MNIKNSENYFEQEKNEIDIMIIPIIYKEEKYLLKIFPSEDKISLIFKLEKENILTYYFIENFFLKDILQKNKLFITYNSITKVFAHLKKIKKNLIVELENKSKKIDICLKSKYESKFLLNFTLRKKLVSQNILNPLMLEQIKDNKIKLIMLKKKIQKFKKIIQQKNDLIDKLNNNITYINNSIKEIKKKYIYKKIYEKKEDISKEKEELLCINFSKKKKEQVEKRYISKNRKRKIKNLQKRKKIVQINEINNNKNNKQGSTYCSCLKKEKFFGNTKLLQFLVLFNYTTLFFIACLFGSIYLINSDLELAKKKGKYFQKKISNLKFKYNIYEDYQKKMIDYKNFIFENTKKNKSVSKFEKEYSRNKEKMNFFGFILKYRSKTDKKGFSYFYNNCKDIKDGFILLENKKSEMISIFSANIHQLISGASYKFIKNKKNFNVKIFSNNNSLAYTDNNILDIYFSLLQSIQKIVLNAKIPSQNYNNNKSIKNRLNSREYFRGVKGIEIYQKKYFQ